MSSVEPFASPTPSARGGIRSPLTFEDLASDLIWPRLLRAGRLALRPAHLGLAFFLVVITDFVAWAFVALENALGLGGEAARAALEEHVARLRFDWIQPAPLSTADWLVGAFVDLPRALFLAHPLASTIGGLVLLLAWSLFGGAIARSTALEFARSRADPWLQSFAAGRRNAVATAVSVAAPLVAVWLIGFLLALGGLVLLRLPVVTVLGGLLYGLFLAAGILAVLLMAGYALGHWMLLPAVACEQTDSIDAMQRAFGYTLGRPLRLVVYLAILAAQGWIMTWLVFAGVGAIVTFTGRCAAAWAGQRGGAMVDGATAGPLAAISETGPVILPPGDLPVSFDVSAWFVQTWSLIPVTLGFAFVLSFVFCGSTLLYLAMRRVIDAQDMNEISRESTLSPAAVAPSEVGDAD
jgi:hypothetical protein